MAPAKSKRATPRKKASHRKGSRESAPVVVPVGGPVVPLSRTAALRTLDMPKGKRPIQLLTCRACDQFVKDDEIDCPFCGKNLLESSVHHNIRELEMKKLNEELSSLLQSLGVGVP